MSEAVAGPAPAPSATPIHQFSTPEFSEEITMRLSLTPNTNGEMSGANNTGVREGGKDGWMDGWGESVDG